MNSKKRMSYRKMKEEAELFPKVWNKTLEDEEVFSFIAHSLPLSEVIYEILARYVDDSKRFELSLSSRYLNNTRKIFPGYYSDKERTVVLLNRFKNEKRNWSELFYWVGFLSERKRHPHVHFLLGVLFLDQYINNLGQNIWIEKSISQLIKSQKHITHPECQKALRALLAFAHYMNQDYETSMEELVGEAAQLNNFSEGEIDSFSNFFRRFS